ncbi:hypothetical protein CLOP_g7849 [Closterium sp. NIES-67]|nr:hypothetical protein CLOP_g7849 [Closterium sp. NIES-67]
MAAAYVYPSYLCFKAMRRRRPDVHELLFFCQFWVLLSLLVVLECLALPLLDWVPMYHEAKLALIVYLWHPKTQGTELVYSMLHLLLARHEPIIDRHLARLEERGRDVAVQCWHAGVAYTGARFEELITYLASLSAQAAASAALRGWRRVGGARERRGGGSEKSRRGAEEEQQEGLRGRRKYLQQYGGEGVQLRSDAGHRVAGRAAYERRLQGDETLEGRGELQQQSAQSGGVQNQGVQRQGVRYRNVDSDSDGDSGESDGGSGGSGRSGMGSDYELVEAEGEDGAGRAAGLSASAAPAGSYGRIDDRAPATAGDRAGSSGWWGSRHLAAGLAGLGRALSPSGSQAGPTAAAPPPTMLHGALPPAAVLPVGAARVEGGGCTADGGGFDAVAPDQVADVATAMVAGEASPHPSGINLRPRRSQRVKKQF